MIVAPGFAYKQSPIVFHKVAQAAGATVMQSVQSDYGVNLIGSVVNLWNDQASTHDYSQSTGANQPTYAANGLNGLPTITFDGTNDTLVSNLDLPAPGTTPFVLYGVVKVITWVSGGCLWGTNSSQSIVTMNGSSPQLKQFNGTLANTNSGATVGSWVRVCAQYRNATTDYLRCGSSEITGTNTGNTDPAATLSLGKNAANPATNVAFTMFIALSGLYPTSGAVIKALDQAVAQKYGSPVAL